MNYKTWTKEEITYLKKNYKDTDNQELAQYLGRTVKAVRCKAKILRLKKLTDGKFVKGHNPWNAGKRIGFSPKSQFKKGHLPANTKHNGAITIRQFRIEKGTREGQTIPYFWIRIEKAKWVLLHQKIWKDAYGPVPFKHVIRFKDGNTLNCTLDNLECISMAANARRNQNYKKASQTHQFKFREREISDQRVLNYLTKDPGLKEYIRTHRPDLIELKRQELVLKHNIKHYEK